MVNIKFIPFSYESELFVTLQLTKERQKGETEGEKGKRNKPIRVAAGWTHSHPPGCTWCWPRVLSPWGQTAEACRKTQQRAAAAGRWLGT